MDTSRIAELENALAHSHNTIEIQRHELTTLIKSKNQELEEILGSIDQIIWYIDAQTLELRYVNDAIAPVFGFTKDDFVQSATLWQQRIHPDDRPLVRSFFETLRPQTTQEIRFRITRADNKLCWLHSRVFHNANLHLFVGVTSDITESKRQSDEIAFLAYHDPLTTLPNRSKLKQQLSSKLDHSRHSPFALILIDLDNFKNINDTMGHEVGDQILMATSKRLEALTKKNHFLSRFGGDEFAILLNSAERNAINIFCSQLSTELKKPFIINDLTFVLSSSIGISLYPEDAHTAESLTKHADTAMYEAKKNGKNQVVYYHSSMQRSLHHFLHIESMIRDGLNDKLFELHFQPLIHGKTHALEGFEALLRLSHPKHGFISPDTLIPVAEKNGDILAIGREVLHQACDFIQEVRKLYSDPFYVAINVSAKQLYQTNFAEELLACLHHRSIPSRFLKVELTESAIMENIEIATQQLQILKEGGVHISLDDFGTGYSSFSHLATLPIRTLKIDKSFVQAYQNSDSNRHIIEAITQLAHVMGMDVTAEGIETEAQCHFLTHNSIDTFQGYFFSKPIPRTAIFNHLSSSKPFFASELFNACAV